MKKIKRWVVWILLFVLGFLFGYLVRTLQVPKTTYVGTIIHESEVRHIN